MPKTAEIYKINNFFALVQEVYSGDDLVLMVDLGIDDLHKKVRARLFGVDTPDAYKAESKTDAGRVREDVKKLVKGSVCAIKVHSERKTGWIVTIYLPEQPKHRQMTLNQYLINKGYVFHSNGASNGASKTSKV